MQVEASLPEARRGAAERRVPRGARYAWVTDAERRAKAEELNPDQDEFPTTENGKTVDGDLVMVLKGTSAG